MLTTTRRQSVLSLRVTAEMRRSIEQLAARMTLRTGQRHTMTDVIEAAIMLLARREGKKS